MTARHAAFSSCATTTAKQLVYVYFEDERALLTPDKACPLRSVFEGGQDCKGRFHSSQARIDELTKFICYFIEQHVSP
jgi:hypothetical protein